MLPKFLLALPACFPISSTAGRFLIFAQCRNADYGAALALLQFLGLARPAVPTISLLAAFAPGPGAAEYSTFSDNRS